MQPDPTWTVGPPIGAAAEGLHQIVARIAAKRPDATALVAGDRRVSYGELNRAADACAVGLLAVGVRRGDRVPILLDRGPTLVTALLGVLKAGAAYALLDPAWPAARVGEVVGHLGAPLVVADAAVPGLRTPAWSPATAPAAPPTDFRPAEVAGDAPCCVFFTSGTTGRPKGVLSPHRGTSRLFVPGSFAAFDERTTIPLAAPVPWDAFSLELWGALCAGGTSVIVSEPYLDAAVLRDGVARHGVDTAWLTSSLFNMIVDEDLEVFRGLRRLLIGGERLSPPHVSRFLRRHPDIPLFNGYGPVESTVFATTRRITPGDCDHVDGIPLGRPVPGTEVYVLDGDRPCAVDGVGEICIAGAGLATEYLDDVALTAAKFTTVRLGGRDVLTYRTGDLGYWGADGLLHYRGRADRQVKIRGHRIEPAEIERRVEELLPVRSCRVVVHHEDARLVAYCVPRRSGDPLADAMPALRTVLPAYQMPAAVVTVDSFPLTPQGKLDERALLARPAHPPGRRPVLRPAAGDAALPLVAETAEVFAVVLGRHEVPPDVPFTDLGGTSLDAGRVCARLAARLGRPVPLSRFIEYPTASALARWLRETDPPPGSAPAPPVSGRPVPLTPMQSVYLTRSLLDPTDLTSHCLLTWVVDGRPDRSALAAAVAAVHRRHEPLRASYRADPSPAAEVLDIEAPPLEEVPDQTSTAAAIAALRTLFAEALLVEEADVWRAAVVHAGTRTVLGCVVHHIAFDGWSESILARDLATAYNAALRGDDPASAPPAPPTMAEAHRRYTERITHGAVTRHRERQRAELTGVPALRWPAGPAAPERTSPALIEASLPAPVVAALRKRAAAAGLSRFTVLLAEYAAAFAEGTGQRDFTIGVPVAQRTDPGLEDAVGCHIAMVCLRLRDTALAGGTIGTRAVGRLFQAAYAAQDVPFHDLVSPAAGPGGRIGPLFQTLFALQDNAPARLPLDGLRTAFVRQPYLELPLELHTELWPADDGSLDLTVYFQPETVARSCAEEIAKRYEERLRAAVPEGQR